MNKFIIGFSLLAMSSSSMAFNVPYCDEPDDGCATIINGDYTNVVNSWSIFHQKQPDDGSSYVILNGYFSDSPSETLLGKYTLDLCNGDNPEYLIEIGVSDPVPPGNRISTSNLEIFRLGVNNDFIDDIITAPIEIEKDEWTYVNYRFPATESTITFTDNSIDKPKGLSGYELALKLNSDNIPFNVSCYPNNDPDIEPTPVKANGVINVGIDGGVVGGGGATFWELLIMFIFMVVYYAFWDLKLRDKILTHIKFRYGIGNYGDELPQINSLWKYKNSDEIFEILDVTELHIFGIIMIPLITYQTEDNQHTYTRPYKEFNSRFMKT